MSLWGTGREPVREDLIVRMERLEAQHALLKAEMTDWLDKVSRFFARHRKRERDALREVIETEDAPHTGPVTENLPGAVLARRGRRVNGLHP